MLDEHPRDSVFVAHPAMSRCTDVECGMPGSILCSLKRIKFTSEPIDANDIERANQFQICEWRLPIHLQCIIEKNIDIPSLPFLPPKQNKFLCLNFHTLRSILHIIGAFERRKKTFTAELFFRLREHMGDIEPRWHIGDVEMTIELNRSHATHKRGILTAPSQHVRR